VGIITSVKSFIVNTPGREETIWLAIGYSIQSLAVINGKNIKGVIYEWHNKLECFSMENILDNSLRL
jgi:hypothetical protein